MGKSRKDSLSQMKKMVMDANFLKMVTFIVEIIIKIKNMEMDHFIGLICVILLVLKLLYQRLNNTMGNGGEVYPMEMDSIKKQMVNIIL